MYEDDATPAWESEAEVRSGVRVALYRELYGEKYKYPVKPREGAHRASGDWDEESFVPPDADNVTDANREFGTFDGTPPEQQERKNYIPPTDPTEFSSLLDPPLR